MVERRMVGLVLGAMLAALVLTVVWLLWFFVCLIAAANVQIARLSVDWISDHSLNCVVLFVAACCGITAYFCFAKGLGIYTQFTYSYLLSCESLFDNLLSIGKRQPA